MAVTDDMINTAAPVEEPTTDTTENPLANNDTVTKIQTAAEIVNRTLVAVVNACVDNARIYDIAKMGDKLLFDGVQGLYKNARTKDGSKVHRGIAFPTSLNVNHIVCHFAPLASDAESKLTLKTGDVVKIEMGAQIDGYPAMVGHTLVVGASKENPTTGKTADVLQAAYIASEAALRLLRPGKTNYDVTDTVQKIVVDEFKCVPVEGMLSSALVKDVLDGEKQIILNPSPEQRKQHKSCEFESGEIWTVDVIVSSGEGKTKNSEIRTTIFKRIPNASYSLKMQSSRKVFSEISTKCGYMPFSLTQLEDETKARVGTLECSKHGLLLPYDILEDSQKGAVVAQFLFTALLMPNGNILKVTQFPFQQELVKSDKQVTDEALKAILASSTKATKSKKKKTAAKTDK